MMTKEQYIESLRKLHMNLWMFGKKIENPVDDPVIRLGDVFLLWSSDKLNKQFARLKE